MEPECVIQNYDAETIYELPLILKNEGLDQIVAKKLGVDGMKTDLSEWEEIVRKIKNPTKELNIALVGKYVELHDAYLSVAEALCHGGIANDVKVNIKWVHSEKLEENDVDLASTFNNIDGMIVPGGFGQRGIEGMIRAIKFARENKIPFFGIGIGMQCAVVEFAQNVCGLKDAHTTEVMPDTPNPVIDFPKTNCIDDKTMRLGSFACKLSENTIARVAYGTEIIMERHRHRYEFNNAYRDSLSKCGMVLSGISPEENFVEIIELKDHPWFVATVFHPEFKSRPNNPHPLFTHFIKAALHAAGK